MKKIIFFDGDGTLWYPKKTKRSEKPHWIYDHPDTKDNYLIHLELTPGVESVLDELKNKGIILVIISANPRPENVAVLEIKDRLKYFNLEEKFSTVRSSPGDDPSGKGKKILEILNDLNLNKEDALMVGDSYIYDYLAASDVGVDALWIENSVSKLPEVFPDNLKSIKEISDILRFI